MHRIDRNAKTEEVRHIVRQGGIELRAAERGPGTLVGYGLVYEQWSDDLGGFTEIVRRGAASKTLETGHEIRSAFGHGRHGPLLGSTRSGTLRLSEDEVGVRYEVDLPDTQVGRDVAELVRRGDVWGSSFAFRTQRDRFFSEDNLTRRELLEIEVFEMGPVEDPAYSATSVALRSLPSLDEVAERAALEALYARQGLTPDEIRALLPASEDAEANGRRSLDTMRRWLDLAEAAQ